MNNIYNQLHNQIRF